MTIAIYCIRLAENQLFKKISWNYGSRFSLTSKIQYLFLFRFLLAKIYVVNHKRLDD